MPMPEPRIVIEDEDHVRRQVTCSIDWEPSVVDAPILTAVVRFNPGREVYLLHILDDTGTPIDDILPKHICGLIADRLHDTRLLDLVSSSLANNDGPCHDIFVAHDQLEE